MVIQFSTETMEFNGYKEFAELNDFRENPQIVDLIDSTLLDSLAIESFLEENRVAKTLDDTTLQNEIFRGQISKADLDGTKLVRPISKLSNIEKEKVMFSRIVEELSELYARDCAIAQELISANPWIILGQKKGFATKKVTINSIADSLGISHKTVENRILENQLLIDNEVWIPFDVLLNTTVLDALVQAIDALFKDQQKFEELQSEVVKGKNLKTIGKVSAETVYYMLKHQDLGYDFEKRTVSSALRKYRQILTSH